MEIKAKQLAVTDKGQCVLVLGVDKWNNARVSYPNGRIGSLKVDSLEFVHTGNEG